MGHLWEEVILFVLLLADLRATVTSHRIIQITGAVTILTLNLTLYSVAWKRMLEIRTFFFTRYAMFKLFGYGISVLIYRHDMVPQNPILNHLSHSLSSHFSLADEWLLGYFQPPELELPPLPAL